MVFRVEKDKSINNEEKGLIDRCQKGDFGAFRELMEQYQSRIYSVCFGILRNREDARDVVQEVFIKVYNSIKSFKGESGLYIWIYRIAVNTSVDYYRKRKRRSKIIEHAFKEKKRDKTKIYPETPGDVTLNIELKDVVAKAINSLPDKHKEVIILREIEGLSYQEIAKVMRCSEGTVMSRLFYARKRLMTILKKYINSGNKK